VTRRFLATVVFTDIVGSTERAAELGDRAWRDLLERHHAVVRRELKAFHGREVGTAGDGFFALFEAPEPAVRCAESIVAAVGTLGLQVRTGVHTGECEVIGGDVGGMAVHIGARVAALAGPDEVLVTGSVRDLMTGSDRHFAGGEPRELKGVADPWPVYRLVPDEANDDALASRRPSMVPLYTRRQRRRMVAGLAAVLVVALALTGFYVLTRSDADVVVGENAVGVIDHGDADRASTAVDVGQRPTAMAVGFGSVWVTNSTDGSVSRIDRRRTVSIPIAVGSSPSGVAVGLGAVWVANSGDSTVSRIDPATSRTETIPVRPGPTGIVVAYGSVWITNALDASVTEIDPDTNRVAHVVPVGAGPTGIAAGAGYLWVTNQGDDTVTHFDPETYVRDSPIPVGSGPVGIAVSNGAAWVANNLEGSLSRIDVEDFGVTARTLDADGGAYGVAARNGNVWVSNEHAGTLMRVTAAKNFRLAATIPLHGAPLGLAYVGDDLWFTSAAGGTALHRGGVLTVVGPGVRYPAYDDPAVLDLTLAYDPATWRLAALIHDGLVGFRREGGVRGAAIVPDLATTLAAPTDGGLTYTFHLHKGVRYSTGAPVLASDIRRGIERTIVHRDDGSGYQYFGVILGGQACKSSARRAIASTQPLPPCDLSAGIVTDDTAGTVTFHLSKPTPEFRYQLSLPSAYAVPEGTPVELEPDTFLPSTGPYMIRSYLPKQSAVDGHGRLELVRNPFFRSWSRAAQPYGYADRIILETGYTDDEALRRVTDGRADMLWKPPDNADRLRTRYGQQLHTNAGSFIRYVYLNTTRPPFDNADARRALAFALSRGAFAADFGDQVTCQLIPPDFPGYQPYCPFTAAPRDGRWAGPDRAKAESLIRTSGTRGDEVVVVSPITPEYLAAAKRLVSLLGRLGYAASLKVVRSDGQYYNFILDSDNQYNAGVMAWAGDYQVASQYLAPLTACPGDLGFFNSTGYCNATHDGRIVTAIEQQLVDPGRASNVWHSIDRTVVHDAAIIPFGVESHQDFVSKRVGNTTVNTLIGPLIALMWVQ
jgi:YVTN family beta-propeller protein